jgi:hypothetical protein
MHELPSRVSCYDRWSVGQSLPKKTPIWGPRPDFHHCQTVAGTPTRAASPHQREGGSCITTQSPSNELQRCIPYCLYSLLRECLRGSCLAIVTFVYSLFSRSPSLMQLYLCSFNDTFTFTQVHQVTSVLKILVTLKICTITKCDNFAGTVRQLTKMLICH